MIFTLDTLYKDYFPQENFRSAPEPPPPPNT